MTFNLYFGVINHYGYKVTREYKNETEARQEAENEAKNFYFKHEGKFGIPSFNYITKEAKELNLPIETLYTDYINTLIRFYVIPTELDSISSKKLHFD